MGSYHFELPSVFFISDFKTREVATVVFFDNSATVNVFRKQPENRHSCLWQYNIIVTPFPEPEAKAEMLWKPVNMHFSLTLVNSFLQRLWLEASSLPYLSDTHFTWVEEVRGLATEQRKNNISSLMSTQKTPDWIVLYMISIQWIRLKTSYPEKLCFLPKISQSGMSNSSTWDS